MNPPSILHRLKRNHYRAILVDPPWAFRSYAAPTDPESDRGVERHYETMSLEAIQALRVQDVADKSGCHLFMWTTGPFMPAALDTIERWGFKYSGMGFVWIKLKASHNPDQLRLLPSIDGDFHVGLGFTTRKNAEFCLLARRGSPRRIAKNIRELIISPRREHSRKPDETRERIEAYCEGPYLELFGRSRRTGWTVRGNEVGKFT